MQKLDSYRIIVNGSIKCSGIDRKGIPEMIQYHKEQLINKELESCISTKTEKELIRSIENEMTLEVQQVNNDRGEIRYITVFPWEYK